MPPGQSWNLYSTGACEALAEKVTGALQSSGSMTEKDKNVIRETVEGLVWDKLVAEREHTEETIGAACDVEVEGVLELMSEHLTDDL
jgi:hypothetical protein